MNKETFAKYISDPSLLDNDTLPEIKAMLDEFPYFQSAWVLYIKNLHAIKDIRYENKLKTASAFVSDRKHLHDLLKGTYIPTITPVPVHTQFIASPQEPEQPQSDDANPDTVETQNLVSLPESQEEDFTPIHTQSIASPQEPEQPQSDDTNPDTVETQNLVSHPETQEEEDYTPVQSQFIAPQQENPEQPQSDDTNPDTVETQNLVSLPESQEEDYTPIQSQFIAPQQEPEPTAPLSIADRILIQMEEMRKAKASAASAENKNSESPVEPQNLVAQSDSEEDVQTQSIASPQEPEQPQYDDANTNTVETQNIVAQSNIQEEEYTPVQPQFIASPQEPEQPQYDDANTDTVETQNLVSLPETQEEDFTPVQTQFIASPQEENVPTPKPEISQQQIKEAIEKQLLSLGINANITFSDGSANIKFENFDANTEKEATTKEENIVEQPAEPEVIAEKPKEERPKIHSSRRQKIDLIDQFLVSEAKIVPIKNYHSDNTLSTESILEDEELFSEKLAKIYIKQGHLEKALTTYEKLYLKYPEKSAYFATQIEYVKRLINK